MNETSDTAVPLQDANSSPAEAPLSAGAMLRQYREAAGLHIAALAVSIRVPIKKLEALESDRYDLLPDAVFARALASSVCRALKVDPEPILQRLPPIGAQLLQPDRSGINVPFQRPGDVEGSPFWARLPRPAMVTVLLLLAGALALLFYPAEQEAPQPPAEPTASVGVPTEPVPVFPVLPAPPVADPQPASVQTPPLAVPVAPAAPTAAAVPAQPAAAVADSTATAPVLQFKTRGASWIEVTDARGTVLLRRNLEPGESTGVSGSLPLSVVIGRADATDVWVRGRLFPLQGVSQENVARFEVKP